MGKNSAHNDLQEDKKYAALIIGGSFLISLFTILAGNLVASVEGSFLPEIGHWVTVLGWVWVLGTFMTGLYIQARMNQYRRELNAVPAEK